MWLHCASIQPVIGAECMCCENIVISKFDSFLSNETSKNCPHTKTFHKSLSMYSVVATATIYSRQNKFDLLVNVKLLSFK